MMHLCNINDRLGLLSIAVNNLNQPNWSSCVGLAFGGALSLTKLQHDPKIDSEQKANRKGKSSVRSL
jgi:hypothetical protein